MTVRRRRRRTPGGRVPLARVTLGAQAVLAALIVVFLFTSAGSRLPFVSHPYRVQAVLPDSSGLDEGDRPTVTVAGVKSGSVKRVSYSARTGKAVVTLELDDRVRGRLFADASVRVQPRSALNDLVVDLDPGEPSAGALPPGPIAAARNAPVGYDRVLGTLDADTRAYTQLLVGTLRQTLKNRPGALSRALDRLPDTTSATTTVARQLADRRHDLSQLVAELEAIVTTTGRRNVEVTRAIALARRTLTVTAARQRELEGSLRELPATLTQADATMGSVRTLARPLNPALEDLRPAARALPASLRRVRRLAPTLRATTRDAGSLVRKGRAPLGALDRALRQLGPASRELAPVVPTTEKLVRALVDDRNLIKSMTEDWPGALSSANSVGVTTRALFFRVLPVHPGAIGFPELEPQSSPSLRRAARTLQRERPELFARPRGAPRAELAVTVLQALVAQRCLDDQDVACTLLALMYDRPPKVLEP